MLARLRALLFVDPLIVVATIVMGTLSLAASLFDSTGRKQHKLARAWARMLARISGMQVRVEGLEKLQPGSNYVLVSNHLSYMDIPAVLMSVPLEVRFFAKKGLFSIPFLGTHLRRAGHMPVTRGDARASLKTLHDAAHQVHDQGISPLIFPEGGRAPGEMRAFKEGAAHLAIKAGIPAVPIGISGTREILPMQSFIVRPGTVHVRIGDPIPTAGMKSSQRSELNRQLREKVVELMEPQPAPVSH